MGQILSEPITEKRTQSGGNERQIYASSEMQGWRISMEDANTAILSFEEDENASFFGVFDGHGGVGTARYAEKKVHHRIIKDPEFQHGNYQAALRNAFLGIDEDLRRDVPYETSGCTAVTLLITKYNRLFCANAGDSRCVLSCKGVAIPLSFDHKPTNEHEILRITEAGSFVQFGRVNANLALSRAFGDFEFKRSAHLPPEKQAVTANPDIIERTISEDDEFIVLACDGIWDVLTNQQVVNFVRSHIARGYSLETICELLLERCLARDPSAAVGSDNMTVIIIGLLMGGTEVAWRQRSQKIAIVDGAEINPFLHEGRPLPVVNGENPYANIHLNNNNKLYDDNDNDSTDSDNNADLSDSDLNDEDKDKDKDKDNEMDLGNGNGLNGHKENQDSDLI